LKLNYEKSADHHWETGALALLFRSEAQQNKGDENILRYFDRRGLQK
jgi:hypothetical protein